MCEWISLTVKMSLFLYWCFYYFVKRQRLKYMSIICQLCSNYFQILSAVNTKVSAILSENRTIKTSKILYCFCLLPGLFILSLVIRKPTPTYQPWLRAKADEGQRTNQNLLWKQYDCSHSWNMRCFVNRWGRTWKLKLLVR